ncbi:uncharacterized protein [Diadema setosum]|uniref:uncharacterized protein n=1 Tax=Diadema setosum TaxID=31175 RepID=UPI003B3B9B43
MELNPTVLSHNDTNETLDYYLDQDLDAQNTSSSVPLQVPIAHAFTLHAIRESRRRVRVQPPPDQVRRNHGRIFQDIGAVSSPRSEPEGSQPFDKVTSIKRKKVCATNGRTYISWCYMRMSACAQTPVADWQVAYMGACLGEYPLSSQFSSIYEAEPSIDHWQDWQQGNPLKENPLGELTRDSKKPPQPLLLGSLYLPNLRNRRNPKNPKKKNPPRNHRLVREHLNPREAQNLRNRKNQKVAQNPKNRKNPKEVQNRKSRKNRKEAQNPQNRKNPKEAQNPKEVQNPQNRKNPKEVQNQLNKRLPNQRDRSLRSPKSRRNLRVPPLNKEDRNPKDLNLKNQRNLKNRKNRKNPSRLESEGVESEEPEEPESSPAEQGGSESEGLESEEPEEPESSPAEQGVPHNNPTTTPPAATTNVIPAATTTRASTPMGVVTQNPTQATTRKATTTQGPTARPPILKTGAVRTTTRARTTRAAATTPTPNTEDPCTTSCPFTHDPVCATYTAINDVVSADPDPTPNFVTYINECVFLLLQCQGYISAEDMILFRGTCPTVAPTLADVDLAYRWSTIGP